MADSLTPSRLEIEVRDFGPIVHGKVDLRPMTVFIGPSNTGKSYLAILVYALHRFFGNDRGWPWSIGGHFSTGMPGGVTTDFPEETIAALKDLVAAVSKASLGRNDDTIALPEPIIELAQAQFNRQADALVGEIVRCFGVDGSATLVRKGQGKYARLAVSRSGSYCATPLEHTLEFDGRKSKFQATIPERVPFRYIADLTRDADGSRSGEYINDYRSLMARMPAIILGDLCLTAFYFPADRTGVMHAHSAIVSAVIGNAPSYGLQHSERAPMLSGVLADFLRQLIEMGTRHQQLSVRGEQLAKLDAASREMENVLLDGSVGVNRSELINYPRFSYRPKGWKTDMPLMNASSMVSEIAPVVLYLRHVVHPGDVLIIEEPESHLHPSMQVEFTRQLANLVQHGYRVIITTHSEWVLEELGNVVQRSQLPEQERAAVSESEVALTPEQVGVWLFRPNRRGRARGSEVVEVKMDESGLYETGFDDVAIALSNDGTNIYNQIGENR